MCNKCSHTNQQNHPKTAGFGASLDTLAQLGTKSKKRPSPTAEQRHKKAQKNEAIKKEIDDVINNFPDLKGKTHVSQGETLKKRANRNYIKTSLAKDLILYSEALTQEKREAPVKTRIVQKKGKRPARIKYDLIKSQAPTKKADKRGVNLIQINTCIIKFFDKSIKQAEKAAKHGNKAMYRPIPTKPKNRVGTKIQTEKTDTKLLKTFRNMYYCNDTVIVKPNGQVITNYCKNRLCIVCNAIRTAGLINQYEPVFKAWGNDSHFVTLTVKNCTGENLKSTISEMNKTFVRIKDRFKKESKRHGDSKFLGVKKIECTSIRKNDYHPHFHFIIKGEKNAQKLVKYWLEDTAESEVLTATSKGQDVKKADENSIKELFKYFTKITSSKQENDLIYIDRNYQIFESMQGKRVFQPFGFKLADYASAADAAPAPPLFDEEEEGENIPFGIGEKDEQEAEKNRIFENFYKYTERTGADCLQLLEDLHTFQADKKAIFSKYKSPAQVLENATGSDILKAIEENEIYNLDTRIININWLHDGEPPNVAPDGFYKFDSSGGNWWNIATGEPLILEYYLPKKIKEATRKVVYPQILRDRVINLLKNNFI